MQNKSFKLELKSLNEKGTFTGMASVFGNVDLGGDIVEPGAFARSLQHKNGEVPILYQHDTRSPIGLGRVQETKAGLEITGELVMQISKAQEAYALMKRGVLKGLSIGFDVVRDTVSNGIRHLHELKLYEVSVVTFPMNEMASISSVKSDDSLANFRATLAECSKRFERR
jgi:HK97 family phage prohead protease